MCGISCLSSSSLKVPFGKSTLETNLPRILYFYPRCKRLCCAKLLLIQWIKERECHLCLMCKKVNLLNVSSSRERIFFEDASFKVSHYHFRMSSAAFFKAVTKILATDFARLKKLENTVLVLPICKSCKI